MGHSILNQKFLKYVLNYDRFIGKNFNSHLKFLEILVEKYAKDLSARREDDNELFRILI